jgi:multiple sugar transport system permease protein
VRAHAAAARAQRRGEAWLGLALLSPAVLLFLALIAYPLLQSLLISLYDVDTLMLDGPFVGLSLYAAALASPVFWKAFANTLVWAASTLLLQLILGLGFALLLHQSLVGRSLARGLVLFPYLLPTAVAVLVWQWLFNDLYGLINHVLLSLHLVSRPIAWLSQMPSAMIGIILVGAWKFFPFIVIAVLARLQTIPDELYDAAAIDGAGALARFRNVTLPQLRGVLLIVLLLRAIWDFKEFDVIYLMTGGGPGTATQTLPLLVYSEAFPLLHLGRGAAIAVLMFVFMLGFLFLYFRLSAEEED